MQEAKTTVVVIEIEDLEEAHVVVYDRANEEDKPC